ncbi:hypothetical protein, partial [Nocardia nova]|uniref:hypothetical protein n=1 Tax=Nocardia nova TaxID=37330 RepID=UPI0025AEF02C
MNDETEPIPVVDPRGGSGRSRHARPDDESPQDRSGRHSPRTVRAATPPWSRGMAAPADQRDSERTRRAAPPPHR